jgi:hypothetical protein
VLTCPRCTCQVREHISKSQRTHSSSRSADMFSRHLLHFGNRLTSSCAQPPCHMRRRMHACHMRRRMHACHMRSRIHACHMRRRIHACHMRRRIHAWALLPPSQDAAGPTTQSTIRSSGTY